MSVSAPAILSAIAIIGLTACGSAPVAPAEEAPLQPPASFFDLSVAAPDDAAKPVKKAEQP